MFPRLILILLSGGGGYKAADSFIVVAMQKVFDTPYVPPLDVATGTTTTNKILEERYWSVFKENAF